jgi:protein-tyrosine phosphatase
MCDNEDKMADGVSLFLSFRLAEDHDLPTLVALRDAAAQWQAAHGIEQWRPGELDESHFRDRIRLGEVWLAVGKPQGPPIGAWELWWEDPLTWGPQPSSAGYVHRLMIDRSAAPSGTGRLLLAAAERRIMATGRVLARLDCATNNLRLRRYYADAGYGEVGEQLLSRGSRYPVTLFEKRLMSPCIDHFGVRPP